MAAALGVLTLPTCTRWRPSSSVALLTGLRHRCSSSAPTRRTCRSARRRTPHRGQRQAPGHPGRRPSRWSKPRRPHPMVARFVRLARAGASVRDPAASNNILGPAASAGVTVNRSSPASARCRPTSRGCRPRGDGLSAAAISGIRFVADLDPDRQKGDRNAVQVRVRALPGSRWCSPRHKRARSAGYAPVSGLGPRALCRSCWPDNEARQQPRGRVHTSPCRASSHHLVPARGRQQIGYAVLDGSWKVAYDTFAPASSYGRVRRRPASSAMTVSPMQAPQRR